MRTKGILTQAAGNYKGLIALNIICGVVSALLGAFAVRYFQKILDLIAGHGGFSSLNESLAVLGAAVLTYGALLVFQCLLEYADNYPATRLGLNLQAWLRLAVLRKLCSIDFRHYQNFGTGQVLQLAENGAAAGKEILFDFYIHVFKQLLPGVLISLVFLGTYSVRVMWVIGGGYIVVFAITNLLLKCLYNIKNRTLVSEEWLNRRYVRALMELVVFRTNRRYAREIALLENKAGEITNGKTQIKLIHEMFFAVFHLIVILVKLAIIIFGVLNYGGSVTVGAIVAMVALTDNIYQPIAIFNVLYVGCKLNRVALERFEQFLNQPDDKNLLQGAALKVDAGRLEFDRVVFSYQGNTILDNVSFVAGNNQISAFAGLSGAGKSTLLKMVTGLLKPDCGRILVDGTDLALVHLDSYYEHIAYVSQDAPVFDGTIRENLVFEQNESDECLYDALSCVRLDSMVAGLQKGLDTEIGERGVKLSGGEKQRLALARLFFTSARLVVLDEATSGLDYLTEQAVLKILADRLRGRTILLVTHRLQTLAVAGNILVLSGGKIVQRGAYDELAQQDGVFRDMLRKQPESRFEDEQCE